MKKLISLLMIVAFISASCKYLKKQEVNISDLDTLLTTEADTSETEPIEIEKPTPSPGAGILTLDDIRGEYHVIIGSFQTREYALEHAKKYATFGYPTSVILKPDGFYMVSLKKYNSRAAAMADMPEFKKRLAVNSWIYGNS